MSMFAFSQIEPNRTGQISRWDIPINRWWDLKFQSGQEDMASTAISRMTEDYIAEGPMISPELANKEWGIPGHLEFNEPVNNQRAALMHDRKKRELELAAYLQSADHSALSWKGISGFGAMMIGNVSHPLDFATMFLPVVGSSAKAKAAAEAGRGVFRQALARGLVTEESLSLLTRYPKFGAAVIDGTIGNALQEIPVFIQKQRDQADYTVGDAALNIASGGVFAGALHVGFRGLSKLFDGLTGEIKERLLGHEVNAFLKGEAADIAPIARVDENAIAARVESDLRAEGVQAVESEMAIERAIAGRQGSAAERPFDVIDAIEGHVGGKIELAAARDLEETFKASGAARNLFAGEGRKLDDVLGALHQEGLFPRLENDEQLLDAIRKAAEARKGYRAQMAAERGLAPEGETNGSRAVKESRIANERERRIREYIESRKPERVAAAKAAELQAQQAQGKLLAPEQIKDFTLAPDERSLGIIDKDAANIEANLKSQLEGRLQDESLTPEQRERLKEQLEAQLAEIEEKLPQDQTKAIEQAKNCLIQNG